jgi:hypothetical protein
MTDNKERILSLYGLTDPQQLLTGSFAEREKWRELGLSNLYFFSTVICGNWRFGVDPMTGPYAMSGELYPGGPVVDYSFHMDICHSYDTMEPGGKRRHFLAPRDHFKTTTLLAFLLQQVAKDHNTCCALVGATFEKQASGMMKVLINQLQRNTLLRDMYGIKVPKRMSTKGITIERDYSGKEHTFAPFGANQSPESGHYRIIANDDLAVRENSSTPDRCHKVVEFHALENPLYNLGGYWIDQGSRFSFDEIHGHILDHLSDLYECRKWCACYDDDGEASLDFDHDHRLFPEEYTPERLREKLDAMKVLGGVGLFWSQFLLEPIDETAQIFRQEWVDKMFIPDDLLPEKMTYYVGWDNATKRGKDSSPLVVIGVDAEGVHYIVEIVDSPMTLRQQTYEFVRLQIKYGCPASGAEAIGTGATAPEVYDEVCEELGVQPFFVEWYKHWDTNKAERARTVLQPPLEMGRLRCKESLRLTQLESQLVRFRGAVNERNDLVDSVLMADLQASQWGYQEEPITPHVARTGPVMSIDDLTEDEIRRLRNGDLKYTRRMIDAGIHMQVGREKVAQNEGANNVFSY